MMTINIPNDNILERKYIINVLFDEFLGLNYSLKINDGIINTDIILENGNILVIEDHFFNKFKTEKEYLELSNIPSKIEFLNSDLISQEDIPIVFGKNYIKVLEKSIICGLDIFASSFFMLTRWEEYVNKERDKHNRFSSKSSLAFKFDFLNRPIVNEYVELLWKLLVHLNIDQKRKERKFQVTPTHDVDLPKLWWGVKDVIKSIAGDVFKRKDLKSVIWTVKNYFKTIKGAKDPFDTFEYLMNLSEKNNLTSHFFFMSGGTSSKDNYYKISNPIIRSLMEEIKDRGHVIGFHPSYNAYDQDSQFKEELANLNENSPSNVNCGRDHFLRFDVPATWQIWEDNRMKWDSSMSYADHEGFRCGVCYAFSVFNVLERKQLKLKEKPLIVMDGSLVTYQNITVEEGYNKVNGLLQKVKKYNGDFVFLWHNSSFNTITWKPFQIIYEKILNENSNNYRSKTTVHKSSIFK